MRRRNWRSLCTVTRQGTVRNSMPRSRAMTPNSTPSVASTSSMRKSDSRGSSAPASSLEISSNAVSSSSAARSELSMRSTARSVLPSWSALAERRGEQARRVQRLQQVVAGRCEEAGLGEVGGLRVGLGVAQCALDAVAQLDLAAQPAVDLGKLAGAVLDPLLEGVEGFLRRPCWARAAP
jgi:hypothetical protein